MFWIYVPSLSSVSLAPVVVQEKAASPVCSVYLISQFPSFLLPVSLLIDECLLYWEEHLFPKFHHFASRKYTSRIILPLVQSKIVKIIGWGFFVPLWFLLSYLISNLYLSLLVQFFYQILSLSNRDTYFFNFSVHQNTKTLSWVGSDWDSRWMGGIVSVAGIIFVSNDRLSILIEFGCH